MEKGWPLSDTTFVGTEVALDFGLASASLTTRATLHLPQGRPTK
jgi:hypothetical protein